MVEVSLIEQVKTGDLTAFEKLVQSTQQRGLNIAYGILNDPYDAEEVLQEAYLQVYHNIVKLKAPEAFRNWFAKIITHLAFRRSREKGRFKTVPLDYVSQVEDTFIDEPETIALKKEQQDRLIDALKTLPDEYKAALILREWEDYSYKEISEILDIPLGTVKSRIFSARKILLKKLGEEGF
ncbi:MAG: ECF RNA polymerase sigma factor SigW [Pelotomaculum sp. PtaB.Bin013]|uniref:Sigma-70 family RNA polymerase sigma factor n=1 Tax=Pelotomaculum isophthalicicum JI TaxID=947010 RepID=A0A9X4JWC9_9FIRM|nr:sigma-70 family RNA polymerase sigma factor [Pelotomaculum isophthalicicum]MDF9408893.1 sigma-70 family RNA polymerase sigma factor [Pelotomaculum isophthalicicum JI]OPX86071.1 MAG: ECF RNA polymerase sigma factor SigW [Pelotomaculum sp. PtaB.Bin013]